MTLLGVGVALFVGAEAGVVGMSSDRFSLSFRSIMEISELGGGCSGGSLFCSPSWSTASAGEEDSFSTVDLLN